MFLWKFINKIISGKIDVSQYPDMGMKFHINTSALTRQLPTLILFENEKESGRVPAIISGKVQKFVFKEDDIVNVFDLNHLYNECKKDKKFAAKIKEHETLEETKKKKNRLKGPKNFCVIQLCKIGLRNISLNYANIWISLNSAWSIYSPNRHSYKLIF